MLADTGIRVLTSYRTSLVKSMYLRARHITNVQRSSDSQVKKPASQDRWASRVQESSFAACCSLLECGICRVLGSWDLEAAAAHGCHTRRYEHPHLPTHAQSSQPASDDNMTWRGACSDGQGPHLAGEAPDVLL